MKFGFVILSHKNPAQLLRLTRALNALYDCPPIACHHDFTQSKLDPQDFPDNVRFVDSPVATAWAKWSLVEATLLALELLVRTGDPDYFFVISSADYPAARPDKVTADLHEGGHDAWINALNLNDALAGKVDARSVGDPHLDHYWRPHNLKLGRDRYQRAMLKVPVLRLRPPPYSTSTGTYPRIGRETHAMPFDSRGGPWDATYQCYVGSQWFTATRKVAQLILNPSPKDQALRRYYAKRVFADESYFQSVLCNNKDLKIRNKTHRFASWDGAHPVDLTIDNLDEIIASGGHFARKFRHDDPVLDAIDRHLGI